MNPVADKLPSFELFTSAIRERCGQLIIPDLQKECYKDSLWIQRAYLWNSYDSIESGSLSTLALSIPPMHSHCILSINLPASQEGDNIYPTLLAYSVKQKTEEWHTLNPDLFEINILLNRPNDSVPFDAHTERQIQKFQQDYPQYHIHVVKKTFHFPDKPIMGAIYKLIADIAILRNLQRNDSREAQRLILRTGGADAREKNKTFLSKVIDIFNRNENIHVYKSESRYPKIALQQVPLFHFLATLESGLNRLYTHGNSNVWLGSYSAHIYALVGGFNPKKIIAEEIDLASRMREYMRQNPPGILRKNLIKNAIDDPRRAIFSLYNGIRMVDRYQTFWNHELEHTLREFHWEEIIETEALTNTHLLLTKENLSREASWYYQDYLKRTYNSSKTIMRLKKAEPTLSENQIQDMTHDIVEKLFRKILRWMNECYDFVRKEKMTESHIVFHNIEKIESLMHQRPFHSHKNFE